VTDEDLEVLVDARKALVSKRHALAKTIATPGEIPESAVESIIQIQQAIEVIDIAMEEAQEADLTDDLDDE
jgi:hypothetical protein